jgi:hypothetical protein
MTTLRADVAELADAQVSEACDGDIVEVQVLSSAPIIQPYQIGEPVNRARFLSLTIGARPRAAHQRRRIILPQEAEVRCFAAGTRDSSPAWVPER